jgi:hypothetical protein
MKDNSGSEIIVLDTMPALKSNEVYVSHVGDHEYAFNIFGSIHTDFENFLSALADYAKCSKDDILIYTYPNNHKDFWISAKRISDDKRKWLEKLAVLTIETINPIKFPIVDN